MIAQVSDGWLPRCDALPYTSDHTVNASLGADGVIKLGCPSKNRFKQFFDRAVSDWFRDRVQGYAIVEQDLPDSKMILCISGKTINLNYNKYINLVFVLSTKLQSS
ncbi:MAG TPA: hypothetical protein VJB64_01750 [Patescibacteria group bacterium]|nr:hypothetical protein [Patescibacteria group bacterium]